MKTRGGPTRVAGRVVASPHHLTRGKAAVGLVWQVLHRHCTFEPVRVGWWVGFGTLLFLRSTLGSGLVPSMVNQRPSPVRLLPTYAAVVGVPALALFVILRVGETIAARGPVIRLLPAGAPPSALVPATAPIGATGSAVPDLPLLFVQIIVILLAARIA